MKRAAKEKKTDELGKEYDLSSLKGGVRGKYRKRYEAGTNLVLLSPDVAKHFPDGQSVNSALRTLIRSGKRSLRRTRPEVEERTDLKVGHYKTMRLSKARVFSSQGRVWWRRHSCLCSVA